LAPLALLLAGCAARLERALLADRNPAAHVHDVEAHYAVHCPDVLEVQIAGLPDWSGPRGIGADGGIALAEGVRVRVDGLTTPEVAAAVAGRARVTAEGVAVHVAGYNSQQLYLIGEVPGQERAVPYRGPETVLDLLQRTGGITPGAAPAEVRVVRAHVADGKPPEVFHVDLQAILFRHDQQTNVRLEPFDQVYVGQNRRSHLRCCVPPWLRPLYERLCGMRRPTGG
jgi:protein involved in polysaccharide export with SLBB domain